MFKRIAFLAASCFVGLSVHAQLTITGTVIDEQDQPLPGANVVIAGTLTGVVTDGNGGFILKNLNPDTYIIRISFLGYNTLEETMDLRTSLRKEFRLVPANILVGEVTVKSTRAYRNDPVAYTNLAREDIDQANKVQDIPYLLAMTPSLVTTSDGGTGVGYTGLRIRGTDPTRINVTINGVPLNDSESHEVYWVDIPDIASSTENIQIQRGVGTSTQGAGAFGANINLQTTSLNPKPSADIKASAGSFNTWKTSLNAGTGLMNDHFSIDTRISRIHSDGYIDRASTDLQSVYFAGGYFSRKNIIKATFFSGHEKTYQAWGGVPSDSLATNRTYNPYTYENEVDDYKQSHMQLSWSSEVNDRLDLSLVAHYTAGGGYYEQYRESEDLKDYLIDHVITGGDTITETDLVRRKWLENDFGGLVYSVNYQGGRFALSAGGGANRYDGDHFGTVVWTRFASGSAPDHEYYFNRGLKTDLNQFLKLNYQVRPWLNLYADMQYRFIDYRMDGLDDDQRDLTRVHRYNFLNPKAGINIIPGENQRIYLSYAIAHREPKRSNFTDAPAGMEIRPEVLRDLEAGYQAENQFAKTSINLYWMDYKDQLVLTGQINDVGAPIMVNIPRSYRAGIEGVLELNPLRRLEWDLNLTLSRNKIMSFTEHVDDWDMGGQRTNSLGTTDISFSPAVIAGSRVTWLVRKNLRLNTDTKYVGRQYIDNTSNPDRSIDPYLVNDIMVTWDVRPHQKIGCSLFFQVNNLFNEMYETNAWVYSYYLDGQRYKMDGYFPQAGRNFLFGLKVSL